MLLMGVGAGRRIEIRLDTHSSNTLAVASTSGTTPTITTAQDGELLVAVMGGGGSTTITNFDAVTGATTASGVGSSDGITNPTNNTWIRRGSESTTLGADTNLGLADALMQTAGATGTVSAVAGDRRHAMAVAAFKPPAGKAWTNIVGLQYSSTGGVASGDITADAFYSGTGFGDFAQGDLLVAGVGYRSNVAFTPPAGWTVIEEQNTGNTTAGTTASIASVQMCWMIRGASAPSFVWTRTGGDAACIDVAGYRAS